MKNTKRKQNMLVIFGLLSILLLTIGMTYAFFNYTRAGSTENSITSGSISFMYTENTKIGKGIMLQDAIPMTDAQGKIQSGEGRIFEFSITSKTGTSIAVPYEVTARMSSDSTLDPSVVKLYLEKGNEEVLLEKYSALPQTTHQTGNNVVEKVIYNGKVPRGSNNYSESFKLRMWIDEETEYSQVEVTKYYCDGTQVSEADYNTCAGEKTTNVVKEYPYNDKLFKITVNVYANGKMLTEEDLNLEKSTSLTTLSLNNGTSLFQEGETSFTTSTTDSNITLNVVPKNIMAKVTVTKTDSTYTTPVAMNDSGVIPISAVNRSYTLTTGENYFKIVITPEDTSVSSQEYHLQVTKLPGTDATLSSISIPDCPLNETFNSETTAYTCTTSEPDLNVVVTTTDSNATYVVDGNTGLSRGSNTVTVTGVAEDGTTTIPYTITVTANIPVTGSYSDTLQSVTLQGLAQMIYNDNTIVQEELTTTQLKSVDTADHTNYLYKSTKTNSSQPTYFFRGKVDNNYVDFAGKTWRIVRINEDGTVRLILDDSIGNYPFQTRYGKYPQFNNYMYFSYKDDRALNNTSRNSMMELDSWYEANIVNTGNSSKVAKGAYYCEQAKVKSQNTNTSVNANMTYYANYDSTFECTEDANNYGMVETNIGLLTYEEANYAGAYYRSATNTAYYLYKNYVWHLMSPAGVQSDYITYWFINNSGTLDHWVTDDLRYTRPVINLKANVTATKDTTTGHYVVQ